MSCLRRRLLRVLRVRRRSERTEREKEVRRRFETLGDEELSRSLRRDLGVYARLGPASRSCAKAEKGQSMRENQALSLDTSRGQATAGNSQEENESQTYPFFLRLLDPVTSSCFLFAAAL